MGVISLYFQIASLSLCLKMPPLPQSRQILSLSISISISNLSPVLRPLRGKESLPVRGLLSVDGLYLLTELSFCFQIEMIKMKCEWSHAHHLPFTLSLNENLGIVCQFK